jgi:restriction endonuclease-like protein
MRYAALLRQELSSRNAIYARQLRLPHVTTYGDWPVIVYKSSARERKHGNFFDASYRCILRNQAWIRRLEKVHTAERRSLPQSDNRWRELDSSMSSDALLMNVFCCPGVIDSPAVALTLGLEVGEFPEFGFRARIPRDSCVDRTEIDMKLGTLLVESKLTETDFQSQRPAIVESYRDLHEVFDGESLPRLNGQYVSYQLIRNVLAAYYLDLSFCVLLDARRPDLIEAWFAVMSCVKTAGLRTRCKALTWQELAETLPKKLQNFLDHKYGIVAPGQIPSPWSESER